MKNLRIFFIFLLSTAFYACSTINLSYRNGKDIKLGVHSLDKLDGDFFNMPQDTNHIGASFFNNFQHDSVYHQKNLKINVTAITNKTLSLKLFDNSTLVDSLIIKGKTQKGYFRIKREWSTDFIAGPLLWALVEEHKYVGLTKENDLVLINSGGNGIILLILFPFFAANGGQSTNQYHRTK